MAEVVWLSSALQQIADQVSYIAQFDPIAAEDIGERLKAAGKSPDTFPNRGRPGRRTGRRELVTVPPYVLEYQVRGDQVVILSVRHGRQRPRT